MKKCPTGYICLSDRWGMPMFLGVLITLILIGLFYMFHNMININKFIYNQPSSNISLDVTGGITMKPGFGDDIANNPYIPPLKPIQQGIIPRNYSNNNMINIKTRGEPTSFAQLGLLTGEKDGKQVVMPLYGRPTYNGSNKYEYYTASDGYNSYKMPILNGNKDCTNEYGCDELYNNDNVQVKGYNDTFKVGLYETNGPRYIPY